MSTAALPSFLEQWNWKPQPEAQKLVDELVQDLLGRCPAAATLAARMKAETGTRFKDWVDHIRAPFSPALRERLLKVGYVHRDAPGGGRPHEVFANDNGMFPVIVLGPESHLRIALKVESVSEFLAAQGLPLADQIIGEPFAVVREAPAFWGDRAELWVIERHGYAGFEKPRHEPEKAIKAAHHFETLRTRARNFENDADGFREVNRLVDRAISDVGRDRACDIFFAAERDYWMRRNRAAQVQFARQNALGFGWANHDHHTYRSSRHCFKDLVALWEKLGFYCRERFYAGAEAEWGAQVMEQPVTGIITFNDVDMSAEELMGDFSHLGFAETRGKLGTVGLWCGLHGEAVLQSGMHHLEAQFDWHALVEQLEKSANIKTMAPFTTFPYLRQAFTEGERWAIDPARIERLLSKGMITKEQADTFKAVGAIGSHLENLERNDGYKGFNQKGVSDIIARTDPRKLSAALAGA